MTLEDFADDLMLSPMPTRVGTQRDYHESSVGTMPAPRGGGLASDMDLAQYDDLAAYNDGLAGPVMDWINTNRMLVIGGAAVLGIVMFTKVGKPIRKAIGLKK